MGHTAARIELLGDALRNLPSADEGLDSLIEQLGGAALRLVELQVQMEQWVMKPDSNSVYWVEVATPERQSRRITLRAAPVHVGKLVQDNVLYKNETVIMTSATLRTAGSFDYVPRPPFSAQDADTATVGSPFDYQESTLLYPPHRPPRAKRARLSNRGGTDAHRAGEGAGWPHAGAVHLLPAAQAHRPGHRPGAHRGRHHRVEPGQRQLTPSDPEDVQGGQQNRASGHTQLLGGRGHHRRGAERARSGAPAVRRAQRPGGSGTHSETFDDPFYHYQVPDAILGFRQGFGRLIRSKTDHGVVVVMDKHVTSKGYGKLFLESLPECTTHKGPLLNLPATSTQLGRAVNFCPYSDTSAPAGYDLICNLRGAA